WHGIAVFGVTNAKIINNTVLAYDPTKRSTWIAVTNGKDGTPSHNVIVRNNIATELTYETNGVIVDHNIVAYRIAKNTSGKTTYMSLPGTYGDYNSVDPGIYRTFVSIDSARGAYDLRPKAISPAVARGSEDGASTTDIAGNVRNPRRMDIGAYAY